LTPVDRARYSNGRDHSDYGSNVHSDSHHCLPDARGRYRSACDWILDPDRQKFLPLPAGLSTRNGLYWSKSITIVAVLQCAGRSGENLAFLTEQIDHARPVPVGATAARGHENSGHHPQRQETDPTNYDFHNV
jgi:hypothetical protein